MKIASKNNLGPSKHEIYYRISFGKSVFFAHAFFAYAFCIGFSIVNWKHICDVLEGPQFFGDKIFKVTVLSRYLELSEPSTYGTIATMGVLSISMLKTMIPDL